MIRRKLTAALAALILSTSAVPATAAPAPVTSNPESEALVVLMLLGIGVALMTSGGGLMMGTKSPEETAAALKELSDTQ